MTSYILLLGKKKATKLNDFFAQVPPSPAASLVPRPQQDGRELRSELDKGPILSSCFSLLPVCLSVGLGLHRPGMSLVGVETDGERAVFLFLCHPGFFHLGHSLAL